jgi:hypothetical protein
MNDKTIYDDLIQNRGRAYPEYQLPEQRFAGCGA